LKYITGKCIKRKSSRELYLRGLLKSISLLRSGEEGKATYTFNLECATRLSWYLKYEKLDKAIESLWEYIEEAAKEEADG
jgi:hypothetical protein